MKKVGQAHLFSKLIMIPGYASKMQGRGWTPRAADADYGSMSIERVARASAGSARFDMRQVDFQSGGKGEAGFSHRALGRLLPTARARLGRAGPALVEVAGTFDVSDEFEV